MNHFIKILPILLLGCFACDEESTSIVDTQTAVVEGYLFAGQPLDSVFITQSFSYGQTDTTIVPIDDLNVRISNADIDVELLNLGDGLYRNQDFEPQSGATYTLDFEYKGETVSAETFIPEKRIAAISQTEVELEKIEGFPISPPEQLDAIEVTWDNTEGDYYYTIIENLENDPEFVNDLIAEFDPDGSARRLFRITEPEITDFYLINPLRDLTQYGTHRIVVFRVNPEYAALYQSAGTSSLSIAEPPTNVSNGLGIFTGVSSDTLFLEVKRK